MKVVKKCTTIPEPGGMRTSNLGTKVFNSAKSENNYCYYLGDTNILSPWPGLETESSAFAYFW
jgi:hypothetical protein